MMHRSISVVVVLAFWILSAWSASARADAGWLLTTADFQQQAVALEAIDAQGIKIKPGAGETVSIPFDAFLQLDRMTPPKSASARFTLILNSGDRLAGEPAGYKDEQIQWRNPLVGEMKVSLKSVRVLLRSGASEEGLDEVRTEDKVVMVNGDSVKGIVTDMNDKGLTVLAGASLEIPFDSIRFISFALAGKPKVSSDPAFRVRLADQSTITAGRIESNGQTLTLTLDDGGPRQLPLAAVGGIEQLNGPVSWLSSRPAEQIVQTPYFGNLSWPTRMDRSVTGRPIRFGNRVYARGIGVHAYSRLDYALDGTYEAFRTQYALDQEEKRQFADVTVRIKLDGKTVYEKANVKANELSPVVLLDLPKGAKLLTLEVDFGQANDTQDRFNWIEPALLRTKPATAQR